MATVSNPLAGQTPTAGFDVDGARQAGYSDDDILGHLTQSRKFDIDGAIKSGYSKPDIIQYLSAKKAADTPPPVDYAAVSRQMEAKPPAVAPPPLPEELKPDQQRVMESGTRRNPRTGLPMHDLPTGMGNPITNLLDSPITGGQQAVEGVEQMAGPVAAAMPYIGRAQSPGARPLPPPAPGTLTPEMAREAAGGLHRAIGGAFEAATPLMAGAAVTAPAATALTVGAGMAAQAGIEHGLTALGLPPEYAGLVGDLAGLVTGAAAHRYTAPVDAYIKGEILKRARVAGIPPPHEAVDSSVKFGAEAPAGPEMSGGPTRGQEEGLPMEAPPPSKTKTISPETPNPPSAALATAPESEATKAIQIQQLQQGVRPVVMFPKGEGQPIDAPVGNIGLTHDDFGNTYWYRTDLIEPSEIHRAARNNELPQLLGARGLGAPDKSAMPPGGPVVVARSPEGVEVQATATTPEMLPETVGAHQPLGDVSVETPERVLGERLGTPEPIRSAAPVRQVPEPERLSEPQPIGIPEPDIAPIAVASRAPEHIREFLGSEEGVMTPGQAADLVKQATTQFAAEDAGPKLMSIMENTKELVSNLVNWANPRRGVRKSDLDAIYQMKGGRDAADFLLSTRLDRWGKLVSRMTRPEMVNFIDNQKTGRAQATPELDALAKFMRDVDDGLYTEIEKYRPTLEYLENHYRVLWKIIPGKPPTANFVGPIGPARTGYQGSGKRPLAGSGGMLKQHTLDTMSEGLNRGGVPYSYNPVTMFQASYADSMKFITAQRIWEIFGKAGTRKFVRFGDAPPEGYVRLNDRLARVYFKVKEGLVNTGEWYVEKNAARVLSNFLSRDLLREVHGDIPISEISGRLGRFMLTVKNASTAVELGLSPFHAIFEGNEAIGSQIGIGLRRIFNVGIRQGKPGEVAKGLREIVTAPGAAVTAAQQGAKAKAAFGDPQKFLQDPANQKWLAANPNVRADVMAFFDGGGKLNMPADYRAHAFDTFKEYWDAASPSSPGSYISAAIRAPEHFNQLLMSPLFEHYIPNLKLGFFLREYALARQEYADRLASGEMTIGQLQRQIVDSVENRFGEMNFDNLFWDRTFKTAAQILLRSVTWKLGNLRANFGAIAGQGREIQRAIRKGESPVLHPNTAWLIGMSVWTAILGGVIHRLGSGKAPQDLKDIVYPVIDKATGIRASIPTYWRDIIHLAHNPGGYVKSSLSGEIGRVADVWENKDFYGTEVYNPDDPFTEQQIEILEHLVPMPFSIQSYKQSKQQAGSPITRAAGFLGFTKAPSYIEHTKAENLGLEFAMKHRQQGARTKEEAARARAQAGIRSALKKGSAETEINEARKSGLVVEKDLKRLKQESKDPLVLYYAKRLPIGEALQVYDVATDAEKGQMKKELRKRVWNARMKPWEWPGRTKELAKKHFDIKPSQVSIPEPIR